MYLRNTLIVTLASLLNPSPAPWSIAEHVAICPSCDLSSGPLLMELPDPVITPDHVYSKVVGSLNSAGRDCKVAPHIRVRVFPVGTWVLSLITGVVGGSERDNAMIVYSHVRVWVFPSITHQIEYQLREMKYVKIPNWQNVSYLCWYIALVFQNIYKHWNIMAKCMWIMFRHCKNIVTITCGSLLRFNIQVCFNKVTQ